MMQKAHIRQGSMVLIMFTILVSIGVGFRFFAEAGGKTIGGSSVQTGQTKQVGTVTTKFLDVHSGNSANSKTIGRLTKNSSAYIIKSQKGWYEITYNLGAGWVMGQYLSNVRAIAANKSSTSPRFTSSGFSSTSQSSSVSSIPLSPTSSAASFVASAIQASSKASSASTGSASSLLTPSAAVSSSSALATSAAVVSAASKSTSSTASAIKTMPVSRLPQKIVAGYYANWSAYSGFTPDKISLASMDVVHYAFAEIGSDLKIAIGDPTVDVSNFSKLNTLKRAKPGLITLISVGGWDGSARFSDMALTDSSRLTFAKSCVNFIKQYGFDGVDIDWEYPVGGGKTAGRSVDRYNFTLLMKTLRETLNTQAKTDGKYYYLTFAGGASSSFANGVQLSTIASYADYAVDMTYDLHGPWDSYTDFNAPLSMPSEPSPQYKTSVSSSVQSWLGAGFPASKLVMGVPFYGYIYSGVGSTNGGLFQPFTSGKAIGYNSIVNNYLSNSIYKKSVNAGGQVPYLYGNGTFISYDDADSIAAKGRYATSRGLRGAAAWELSFDRTYALIRTVYNNIK